MNLTPGVCARARPGATRLASALFSAALALPAVFGGSAYADGPHIAYHGSAGPYTVTLFSAPDPLVTGPVQLTLLVQNSVDGAVAAAPVATALLRLPGHAPVACSFSAGGAANRVLPGATLLLAGEGDYSLTLTVRTPGQPADTFAGTLLVASNHGQRDTVLLSGVATLVLIAFFLTNQYAKQQQRRRRSAVRAG